MSDEDTHTYGIYEGQTPEGESVTMFDAPGEQTHHWQEGTAPEGSRIIQDEYGNMVAWNGETGEVITAMHQQDPQHPDESIYETSRTNDLEF
jgi:hypothetical protein